MGSNRAVNSDLVEGYDEPPVGKRDEVYYVAARKSALRLLLR
jgi:hypothetical protein